MKRRHFVTIRRLISSICGALFLMAALGGCAKEWIKDAGRGDWAVDLFSGYTITKVNSRGIILSHASQGIVLNKFFITGLQVKEPYVCLRGIPTKDVWITDEELSENKVVYYFLNADTDELAGPFDNVRGLIKHGNSLSVTIPNRWITIDRTAGKPPELRDTGMIVPHQSAQETVVLLSRKDVCNRFSQEVCFCKRTKSFLNGYA